jgi:hypothetical protein
LGRAPRKIECQSIEMPANSSTDDQRTVRQQRQVSVDRDAGEFLDRRARNRKSFKTLQTAPREWGRNVVFRLVLPMRFGLNLMPDNGLCDASVARTPTHHLRTRRQIVKERSVPRRQLDQPRVPSPLKGTTLSRNSLRLYRIDSSLRSFRAG